MKWVHEALASQPPRRRAVAVQPASHVVQLGEVVLDDLPVGLVHEPSKEPAHVRPCGS